MIELWQKFHSAPTSKIKLGFIFGLIMKFYMKTTPKLNILYSFFKSASFGKLRQSSQINFTYVLLTIVIWHYCILSNLKIVNMIANLRFTTLL